MMRTFIQGLACLLLIMWGCGKPPTPITGQVSYQNKPLNYGRIYFNVDDGKWIASSEIHQDGTFVLDQLQPGTAKVAVVVTPPPKPDPNDPTAPHGQPLSFKPLEIPDKFATVETSGVSVTIEPGKLNYEVNLE